MNPHQYKVVAKIRTAMFLCARREAITAIFLGGDDDLQLRPLQEACSLQTMADLAGLIMSSVLMRPFTPVSANMPRSQDTDDVILYWAQTALIDTLQTSHDGHSYGREGTPRRIDRICTRLSSWLSGQDRYMLTTTGGRTVTVDSLGYQFQGEPLVELSHDFTEPGNPTVRAAQAERDVRIGDGRIDSHAARTQFRAIMSRYQDFDLLSRQDRVTRQAAFETEMARLAARLPPVLGIEVSGGFNARLYRETRRGPARAGIEGSVPVDKPQKKPARRLSVGRKRPPVSTDND